MITATSAKSYKYDRILLERNSKVREWVYNKLMLDLNSRTVEQYVDEEFLLNAPKYRFDKIESCIS